MDRNLWWGVRKAVGSLSLSARRAWIEIGSAISGSRYRRSLSARRAWIEITQRTYQQGEKQVALRKESVDRNIKLDVSYNIKETSLSARRAWIEISFNPQQWHLAQRRSPQGERG